MGNVFLGVGLFFLGFLIGWLLDRFDEKLSALVLLLGMVLVALLCAAAFVLVGSTLSG